MIGDKKQCQQTKHFFDCIITYITVNVKIKEAILVIDNIASGGCMPTTETESLSIIIVQ